LIVTLLFIALLPFASTAHCRLGYFFCLGHKRSKKSSQTEGFFAALAFTLIGQRLSNAQIRQNPGWSLLRPSRARPVRCQNTYALHLRTWPAPFCLIFVRSCRSDKKVFVPKEIIPLTTKMNRAKTAGGTALGEKVAADCAARIV
jgi:hypothetical protein